MTAPVYTVANNANSEGVVNIASGKVSTDAGTAVDYVVTLGFTPRYVCWVNATDRITDEWYEGMADDSAIETAAAGTRTLETSGGITVSTGQFSVDSTIIVASKVFYWQAVA